MRFAFAVLLAPLLFGCGPSQRQLAADITRDYEAALASCERSFPERYKKPVTPRMRCFVAANSARAVRENYHTDLMDAMNAQMLVAAERFDAGRLTETRFEAEKATIYANFEGKMQERDDRKAMVRATQAQANAAANAAMAASIPKSVTCYTTGRITNCY